MTTVPPTSSYSSSYIPSPPSSLQSYKSSSSSHSPVQIFDLQDVLLQYQSQPELLKLILSSKVEEDKRRTEEAKLRAKELDLELRQDRSTSSKSSSTHKRNNSLSSHSSNSSLSSSGSSNISHHHQHHHHHHRPSSSSSSPSSPYHLPYPHTTHHPHSQSYHHHHHQQQPQKRISLRAITAPYPSPHSSREIVDEHQERRNSAAVAMVAMGTSSSPSPPPSYFPASPSISSSHSSSSAYPSPTAEYYSSELPAPTSPVLKEEPTNKQATSLVTSSTPNPITTSSGRARRKREMQAITKIVETREFPYQDSYFWKNNGNTTQRKTGCKSIYYKCSNSNKGCPVNKTVTERPNGEYIIKYRGQHLLECGRVERIVDL